MWGVGAGTKSNKTEAVQGLEGELREWAPKPKAWGRPCKLTSSHCR